MSDDFDAYLRAQGLCRICYGRVETISDVCPRHERDARAHALRALAQQPGTIFNDPGRIVVKPTPPPCGMMTFVVRTSDDPLPTFNPEAQIDTVVPYERVHLQPFQFRRHRHDVWVYAHGPDDVERFEAFCRAD